MSSHSGQPTLSEIPATMATTMKVMIVKKNSAFPGTGSRAGIMPLDCSSMSLLSSGRVAGEVDDLQLDSVWVVEENGVVAGDVAVLARWTLDRRSTLQQ